jgi:methyltransferase
MAQPTPAQHMEQVIRTYFQACNEADAAAIAACFCPEAIHYLPPPLLRWSGAATISSNFVQIVREQGRCWTVDQLLTDADRCAATVEWTSFNRQHGRIARGVDWVVFEPQTWRIQEVRSYTAAPIHPDMARQEFVDFDYAGRGYPTTFPAEQRRGEL